MAKLEKALHEMSPALLKPETYDLMWTNRQLNNRSFERFGLGWLFCSEKYDMFCLKPVDPEGGGSLDGSVLPGTPAPEGKVVSKDGAVPG